RKCGVRLRRALIELQRLQRRRACLRHDLFRRARTVAEQQGIGIRQRGMGARISRVSSSSPLKITDGCYDTRGSSLVEEVLSFQVQVIGRIRGSRARRRGACEGPGMTEVG